MTRPPSRSNLAARAAAAHTHRPGTAAPALDRPVDPALDGAALDGSEQVLRRRFQQRVARTLTVLLGVDPAQVTIGDDPDRYYSGRPGHLATHTEPDGTRWQFAVIPGTDDEFFLLRACPGCGAPVPHAEITELADLGAYLHAAQQPDLSVPFDFATDSRHHPDCRFRTLGG